MSSKNISNIQIAGKLAEYLSNDEIAKKMGISTDSVSRYLRYYRSENRPKVLQKINVLLLDIETTPIESYTWDVWKQNIHPIQIIKPSCMLSWSAKWLFDTITESDIMTPDEAIRRDDERIVKSLWSFMEKADIIIAHNGCVAAGNKVLKADFTWEPVENLKKGDKLIAFNESKIDRGRYKSKTPRKYEISEIVYCKPILKECSKIEFSDGTSIIASNDHPWLARYSKNYRHWKYTTTDQLKSSGTNSILTKVLQPWEKDENQYHAGYLAGFFDADGCLAFTQRKGRINGFVFSVSFSQKDSFIIEKLKESLNYYGFRYSILNYDTKHKDIRRIEILGGISERLRFLSTVCPQKVKRFDLDKFSQIKMSGCEDVDIISVTPIGIHEVIGLETSSKTYIVNGFPCHNSKFDIPKINTRFLIHGLTQPAPYKIIDTCLVARKYFAFEHNKLDYLAERLGLIRKIETDFQLWIDCIHGDQFALDEMRRYNENDVLLLEEVYVKLRPWIKDHPNLGLFIDANPGEKVCRNCGSTHLEYAGYYYTPVNKFESWKCIDCGAIGRSRISQTSLKKDRHILQEIS